MGAWPRRVHGHTLDRRVDFLRRPGSFDGEEVGYEYRCVGCGLRVEGPDDARLAEVPCRRLTHDWGP